MFTLTPSSSRLPPLAESEARRSLRLAPDASASASPRSPALPPIRDLEFRQVMEESLSLSLSLSILDGISKFQKLEHASYESISDTIREASRDLAVKVIPKSEAIGKIETTLSLITIQEFLMESVGLAKDKAKGNNEDCKELDDINDIVELVNHMLDKYVEEKQKHSIDGVPIPADFCCPLSLQLMSDPVIVASGQTYEHVFIRKWFDLGYNICPKTSQVLGHTKLIPNFTIKQLIENWCEMTVSSFKDTYDSEPDSLGLSTATAAANKSLLDDSAALKQMRDDGSEVSDEEQHLKNNDSSYSTDHHDLDGENVRVHTSSDSNASEITQDGAVNTCSKVGPDVWPRLGGVRSRNQPIWWRWSDKTVPRIGLSSSMDSRSDFSVIDAKVRNLIEELQNDSEVQRSATGELRVLSRHSMENRVAMANCGAIPFLINSNIIYVLHVGNPEAKANSAATLFSLSVIEENKIKTGRSGAIEPLVDLLGDGTAQGKKDATTALFNLSIFHENKALIVKAGAVKHLVELMDPASGMVDKVVAVLANLATLQEGRNDIAQEEVVELGSARSKENAAAALLQLCTNSSRFCTLVLHEGVVPPLVALSQSGTARAKEKVELQPLFYLMLP
ncbi:hypothetical protein GUJ93_ZPchr0001g32671 [Zizania palustris]|uniref:U-box domain-containing protein n=1 Tax=Zizania palustris TaxID=103762 RepID=A0A8J5RPV4_ZIZPA|nr:hypothetical protein GUJ93_ZPchr0001g32671 [Zizania palustris]